jgi:hypothetical protein
MQYFPGGQPDWALSVSAPEGVELSLHIEHWPGAADGSREWSESASRGGGKISHVIKGLTPNAGYELDMDGRPAGSFRADKQGQVEFSSRIVSSGSHRLKISMTN